MLQIIEFETRSQRRVKCRGVALRAQADMGPTDRREMADRMARGWSDAQTQAAAQEGARTIGSRWGRPRQRSYARARGLRPRPHLQTTGRRPGLPASAPIKSPQGAQRRPCTLAGRYRSITPQAIRAPELPEGSVTMSSGSAWITMAEPSASKSERVSPSARVTRSVVSL